MECWGAYKYATPVAPPPGEYQTVSAGRHVDCGVLPEGVVECWGLERHYDATVHPNGELFSVLSNVAAISASGGDCGLKTNSRRLACWRPTASSVPVPS